MQERYVSYIRRFPLFAKLPEPQFNAVLHAFQVLGFQPGQVILQQGQPTRGLYIFVNGQGILFNTGADGVQRQVGSIQGGQFINQDALYEAGYEQYTLKAAREMTALHLARQALYEQATQDSRLVRALNIDLMAQGRSAPPRPAPPQQPPPQRPAAPPLPQQPQQGSNQPQPLQQMRPINYQQDRPQWPQQPQANPQPQAHQQPAAAPPQANQQPSQRTRAPQQKSFPMQNPGEELLLMTRRHWWAYARYVPIVLLVFGLLVGGVVLVPELWFVLLPLALVIPGAMCIYLYAEWANDAVYITDQRVLRVNRTIFAFREVMSEVSLESIQEVNADKPARDLLAVLLNYGSVTMRTAGTAGNFVLDMVPNPDRIQETILEDQRQMEARRNDPGNDQILQDLQRWVDSGNNPNQPANNPNAPDIPPDRAYERAPFSPFVGRFALPNGDVVYRKHWLVWFGHVMRPGLLLLIAFGLLAANLLGLTASIGIITWPLDIVLFIAGVLWFFYEDWDWRHDYYVLSDTVITLIHKRPLLLQNEEDQILLRQVDNVVSETSGFFQQLFSFGDVSIALLGGDQYKTFKSVRKPSAVRNEITQRQALVQQNQQGSSDENQRQLIGEYISAYHERYGQQGQQNQQGQYSQQQNQQGQQWPDVMPPDTPTNARPSPLRSISPQPDHSVPPRDTNSETDRNRPPRVPRTSLYRGYRSKRGRPQAPLMPPRQDNSRRG